MQSSNSEPTREPNQDIGYYESQKKRMLHIYNFAAAYKLRASVLEELLGKYLEEGIPPEIQLEVAKLQYRYEQIFNEAQELSDPPPPEHLDR